MLGRNWRLRASNTQNQAITVTVKARYFKFDSSGALVWSNEVTLIDAVSVASSTGSTASSNIDNSTDKYIGMEMLVTFQAASTTSGTGAVTLSVEQSSDGGTSWPTQDRGLFAGAETLVAADGTSSRSRNFTFV